MILSNNPYRQGISKTEPHFPRSFVTGGDLLGTAAAAEDGFVKDRAINLKWNEYIFSNNIPNNL